MNNLEEEVDTDKLINIEKEIEKCCKVWRLWNTIHKIDGERVDECEIDAQSCKYYKIREILGRKLPICKKVTDYNGKKEY